MFVLLFSHFRHLVQLLSSQIHGFDFHNIECTINGKYCLDPISTSIQFVYGSLFAVYLVIISVMMQCVSKHNVLFITSSHFLIDGSMSSMPVRKTHLAWNDKSLLYDNFPFSFGRYWSATIQHTWLLSVNIYASIIIRHRAIRTKGHFTFSLKPSLMQFNSTW